MNWEYVVFQLNCIHTDFNPTSTSGPDGYINYKMPGREKLGSGADRVEDAFIPNFLFTSTVYLLISGKIIVAIISLKKTIQILNSIKILR